MEKNVALPVEKHQLFLANAVPTVSVSAPDASESPLGLIFMTLSSLTSEEQPSIQSEQEGGKTAERRAS